MPRLLRSFFGEIPPLVIALFIAVFLWFMAVLDRNYVTSFSFPVELGEVTTAKIITGLETRAATATIEGKGRDLVGLRLRQPSFRLNVPEARAGIQQLRLNPADLNLPKTLVVRALAPEYIELKLNEVGRRSVAVEVPLKGQRPAGMTVTSITPLAQVTLVGPQEDVPLFSTVFTESLDLTAVHQTDTVLLKLRPPAAEGFSTEPESVPVAVAVEKEGARIFLAIPVRPAAPHGRPLDIEPDQAQIAVAGPSSRLDGLRPNDINARIKVADLEPGRYRLAAEITLPQDFHLVRCEPALFDVTVK